MTDHRPYSRKRSEADSSGGVNKRGEGLGTGPVGSSGYQGRGYSSGSRSSFQGGGGGRGGSSLITIIILAAALLFGGGSISGLFSSGSSDTASTSAASGVSFQQPTTTYTDASSSTLNTAVASGTREKFTKLRGSGDDKVTVLVYMCGADLESDYGMATSDINEMAYAEQSDKVNVILETGGAKKWQNSVISADTLQRWKVTKKSLQSLDRNVGDEQMTESGTLADFLKWGVKTYPADRYFLILWDHGGGSVTGYGYDENHPNGSLQVDGISDALKQAGAKFDFVGFDACLMANVETAVAVQPYADYLIGSEETEPGTGWYYTDWLSSLAANTSIPTTELGQQIVDTFITASAASSSRDKTTLSITDLGEFASSVPSRLASFARSVTAAIKSDDYQKISDARSVTREFAQSNRLDQIDLVHFCMNVGSSEADDLASALKSCVKYNRSNNIKNAYGLSIYFPYYSASRAAKATALYSKIGMEDDYTAAVRSFATMESSGQMVTGNTTNSIFDLLGGSQSSNGVSMSTDDILSLLTGGSSGGSGALSDLLGGSTGVDSSSLDLFSQLIGKNHVDSANLVLSARSGQPVLNLPESQWKLIRSIALNVWTDDGGGYIDLGLDDVFQFNDHGELIVDYDGKWIALNGQVVAYYVTSEQFESEDNYVIDGYVPAMINGQRANIILEFTDEKPEGTVLGAQTVYDTGTEGKGLRTIEDGSTIDFLCDYYDYSGNYSDSYYLGAEMTVSGGLTVSTYQLSGTKVIYGYQLTDLYDSHLYTPMLSYGD
jgi:hypothetical protein